MRQIELRSIVSIVLALLVPAQLMAQDAAGGMVYSNGTAWVNGTEVPKSVAMFPGDVLQTKEDSSANLSTNGSAMMISSNSLVKYEGTAVNVDRGAVRVTTGNGFAAHVCEVKARPAENTQTQYQFTHVNHRVEVVATKGDVIVEDHNDSKKISEGQQVSREDGCEPVAKRNMKRRPGAATAAGGGILSSSVAIYTGIGIVGGITTWVLLQGDNPLSPACPDPSCP